MRKFVGLSLVAASTLALVVACARGPATPVPPTVRVSEFRSTLFTPDYVRFFGRIVIDNNMRAPLGFEKVDYGMSLFDKDLLTETFTGMKTVKRHGVETVNLPMRIPMKEILAQHVAILAEGKMKFTFRGSVYPSQDSGFGPIPFTQTIEIPLPNVPRLSFLQTSGIPLTDQFRVEIGVENTNNFAISINNVDTYLDLNGQRYTMLRTDQPSNIPPGQSGTVVLSMHASKTAALSMALNAIENNAVNFKVGGSFTAGTPYGYVFIPVEIEAKSKPK